MSGLVSASTKDLETFARALEEKTLRPPLTVSRLRAAGFGRLADHFSLFASLDRDQALGLVQCVLAEREQRRGPELELVWTGPDVPSSVLRDTAVVVRDLFASARSSVLVGGCYFSHGEQILKPLHQAIRDRGVKVTFCMDIPGEAPDKRPEALEDHVRREVRAFLAQNWPFGPPLPSFYYDPRTVVPGLNVLLHSKCVVVDLRTAFITSANFTHNGQERNLETGVKIEDPAFAAELSGHWHALIHAGLLRQHVVRESDLAGSVGDRELGEWEDLRDLVAEGDLPLFDALKKRSLPPPTDVGYELLWQGRVTGDSALLYWDNGGAGVGLVRAGARADNLIPIEVPANADADSVAATLKHRLRGHP
jgi:phosphatidylserine/phosphatidylglycerophosphate/cardiolipin synthase-like enzyme